MQPLSFRYNSPERMKNPVADMEAAKKLHLESYVYGRFFFLISRSTHKTHARLHISNAESQLRFLFHFIPHYNLNKCSHEVKTHVQNCVVEWFYYVVVVFFVFFLVSIRLCFV